LLVVVEPRDCRDYKALLASQANLRCGVTELSRSRSAVHDHGSPGAAFARAAQLRTVWRLVSRHQKSPKLRQTFSIQPLLVGGNPFEPQHLPD
jgi:phytoene desaturase